MQMSRREERISAVETRNSASTLTSTHWRELRSWRGLELPGGGRSAQSNNQLPWPGAGGSKYWWSSCVPIITPARHSTA